MASQMDKVVVIGAGMGGLAASLRLAHAGYDVTLIETGTPGGKMRTLPSVAGPVDAGPTVLTLRAVFDERHYAGLGGGIKGVVAALAGAGLCRSSRGRCAGRGGRPRAAAFVQAKLDILLEALELVGQPAVFELKLFDLAGQLPDLVFHAVDAHAQLGRVLGPSRRGEADDYTGERHHGCFGPRPAHRVS